MPTGTIIFEGAAAPQNTPLGGQLLGGGSQVYIPRVNPPGLLNERGEQKYAYRDLTTILSRCATLLQQAGEIFWSQKIQKILLDTNSDLTLQHLNEILSWYGGMGSFNDVILSQINGHDMDDLEVLRLIFRQQPRRQLLHIHLQSASNS